MKLNVATLLTPDQRTDWPVRYPHLWRVAAQGYQWIKRARRLRYRRIYRMFQSDTMMAGPSYADNLALCESVSHLPGAVVECGTWRGGMIAGIATLLGPERAYFLYDSFEGLPPAGHVDRNQWQTAAAWQAATTHNDAAPEQFARDAMRRSGASHVTITKGWFADTLPHYSGEPIAILRLDGDWYQSTKEILESLYSYVVPGGILIFDDYYYWAGCAKAVHEFLAQQEQGAPIRVSPGGYAYVIKPPR